MRLGAAARRATATLLLAAAAALAAAALPAAASPNAVGVAAGGSGYIPPPTGVPEYNPGQWNRAYKVALSGLPASHTSTKELAGSLRYPNTMMVNLAAQQDCSWKGFDTTAPASAPLGACFARSSPSRASATDVWVKVPGLALVNSNCYCYALGFFRGGYCYPGTRVGGMDNMRQRMTCRALNAAVAADGGEAVPRAQALAPGPPSKGGHYIAVMARPESCIKGHCYLADFHAMRKDAGGTWSWKHPGMAATNRDLFGALVTDPEAAALLGHYQLCGYFRVEPAKMLHTDKGSLKQPGPLALGPMLDRYRAMPGVTIEVTPLPYNEATDAAVTTYGQQVTEEDRDWERGRGSEAYQAWRIREKQALELLPRRAIVVAESTKPGGGGAGGGGPVQQASRDSAGASGAAGGGSSGSARRLLAARPERSAG